MNKFELRIEALKFVADIVDTHTDMDDHPSTPEEVIDEAYEICQRLRDEADEITKEQEMYTTMREEYSAKRLVTPVDITEEDA